MTWLEGKAKNERIRQSRCEMLGGLLQRLQVIGTKSVIKASCSHWCEHAGLDTENGRLTAALGPPSVQQSSVPVGSCHTQFQGSQICSYRIVSPKQGSRKKGYGMSFQVESIEPCLLKPPLLKDQATKPLSSRPNKAQQPLVWALAFFKRFWSMAPILKRVYNGVLIFLSGFRVEGPC